MRHITLVALILFCLQSFPLIASAGQADEIHTAAVQGVEQQKERTEDEIAAFEQELCTAVTQGTIQSGEQLYARIKEFRPHEDLAGKLDVLGSCIHVFNCLMAGGKCGQATDLMEEAMQDTYPHVADKFPFKRLLHSVIGFANLFCHQYERAQRYCEEALRHPAAPASGVKGKEGYIQTMLFCSLLNMKRFSEAKQLVPVSLANHVTDPGKPLAAIDLLLSIAATYEGLERHACALFFAKLALAQARAEATDADILSHLRPIATGEQVERLQKKVLGPEAAPIAKDFIASGDEATFMNATERRLYAEFKALSLTIDPKAAPQEWKKLEAAYADWLQELERALP